MDNQEPLDDCGWCYGTRTIKNEYQDMDGSWESCPMPCPYCEDRKEKNNS